MKILVDNALSPLVADRLRGAGHDVAHVRDHGLASAPDAVVLGLARAEERVVISADTDFGTLLASTGASRPSVVLVRGPRARNPSDQAALLIANLPAVAEARDAGAIVVIDDRRVRVRVLPILS